MQFIRMELVRMARRNVNRQARRSNLLAGAIGFGLAIIILVNSFTAGVVQSAQAGIAAMLGGHVFVSGNVMLESGRVISRITDPALLERVLDGMRGSIAGVRERSTVSATFIFGSTTTRGTLYGVEWAAERSAIAEAGLTAGSLERFDPATSVVISESIAAELGVVVGERVIVRLSTVTGQANVAEFNVAAIVAESSSSAISSVGYAAIETLNGYLGLAPHEYQVLSIALRDVAGMERFAGELKSAIALSAPVKEADSGGGFGPMRMFGAPAAETPWEGTRFAVATLDDYMGPLTQLVTVLNAVALGLFAVLLVIIMVGIMNTFRMVLIERTLEIGTMRAVGLQRRDVRQLFLLEALFVAGRGAIFGFGGAALIGAVVSWIPFDAHGGLALMLREGHVAFPLIPGALLQVLVILTIGTMVAAWLPARKAAQLLPAEALRA